MNGRFTSDDYNRERDIISQRKLRF